MIKKLLKSIRNNTLVGLFLTVPIMVTILIVNFLFGLATDWALHRESLMSSLRSHWYGDYVLQVLALIFVIIVFYLVGVFTRNFLGRYIYKWGDTLLTKIPIIKNIYVSVRQISESLFTQRKTLFKEVVLVEYPKEGLFSLAFVTANAPDSVAEIITAGEKDEPCVSLFISTTPNPTSGVFILVPRSKVTSIKMPVADALTFIMSAGAVSADEKGSNAPTLLDKLEKWLRHDSTPKITENSDAKTPNT
jgi:uncharacterized membrane protein